jgi:hypothetical protein
MKPSTTTVNRRDTVWLPRDPNTAQPTWDCIVEGETPTRISIRSRSLRSNVDFEHDNPKRDNKQGGNDTVNTIRNGRKVQCPTKTLMPITRGNVAFRMFILAFRPFSRTRTHTLHTHTHMRQTQDALVRVPRMTRTSRTYVCTYISTTNTHVINRAYWQM